MATVQTASEAAPVTGLQSRLSLRGIELALVALGLIVTVYLSYVKLTDVPMACVAGGAFNCDVVQNSAYSRLFGIPIAWLGLGTYLILGVLLVLENRIGLLRDYGIILVFGIALFAFIYSVFLVYVQVAILQALCPWCLAHELIMTFFFIAASIRLWKAHFQPAA
jgi:uncharacterized membrane protein